MLKDYLIVAFRNIIHRKLRSWLTVLGIVIGVGSVIALLAASQGLERSVTASFEELGANRIYIMSGAGIGAAAGTTINSLTKDDYDVVNKIAGTKWVVYYQQHSANVELGREKEFAQYIFSIPTDDISRKLDDFSYEIDKGRMFNDGETDGIVIGPIFAADFFDKEVKVGNRLTIKGKKIPVIGIFKPIGSTQDDSTIIISQDLADQLFDLGDEVTFIEAHVQEGVDINAVADDMERKLKRSRDDENFEVLTPESVLESFGRVLGVLQFVLIGVAGISLLVGGIGIMNSMFTNVLERTKEIGIMKSIGAKNSDILILFLLEAGLVGLIGGVFGVLLGVAVAKMIEQYAALAGFTILQIDVGVGFVAFGLIFAIGVGMISGFVPAWQASKLVPVDALRGPK